MILSLKRMGTQDKNLANAEEAEEQGENKKREGTLSEELKNIEYLRNENTT